MDIKTLQDALRTWNIFYQIDGNSIDLILDGTSVTLSIADEAEINKVFDFVCTYRNGTTLHGYKAFRDYLYMIGSESTTEEELETYYDECFTITLKDHVVEIPFDATAYNNILTAIENIIKEF